MIDKQIRRIGDYTVEINPVEIFDARHAPKMKDAVPVDIGWTHVRIMDVNGAPFFMAILPEDQVLLEIVVQLERAKAFTLATRVKEVV